MLMLHAPVWTAALQERVVLLMRNSLAGSLQLAPEQVSLSMA
jgi:hypothetical protein